MTHELKILPQYFEAVKYGAKTFELRKNDRGFQVGDFLKLKECTSKNFTGRELLVEVTYVLTDTPTFGLKNGFAVLGIKPC